MPYDLISPMRILLGVMLGCGLIAADDRVPVDNNVVRVLKAVEEPHQKTPFHGHAFNRVIVYLDAGDMETRYKDGRVDRQHWNQEQVVWAPVGGRHSSENVGTSPMRIIEVELKKPAPKTPPLPSAALDPMTSDATHNILLFENDQVRVFRSWREAGGTEIMDDPGGAGRLMVLLSETLASVKSAEGGVMLLNGSPGDVLWSGPAKQSATNVGRRRFDMIVVDVK